MPSKKDLMREVAALESINDQLMAELAYVDYLMRQIGFSNGLKTVKETAKELIEEQSNPNESKPKEEGLDLY